MWKIKFSPNIQFKEFKMTDKIKEIFESGKSDKEIVEELMSIVSASQNHQHQF